MRPTRLGPWALALLIAAACGGGGTASSTAAVRITGFQFTPATIEVARGTAVTWQNDDAVLHTVTAGTAKKLDDLGNYERRVTGTFDGRMEDAGTSFSFTFTEPGEHAYFCDRHPHMAAKVVVR